MTIILHIGTHKTGTTAIQKFAAAHRRELRERGLWYPSYAEIGAADRHGHHQLAHAIAGERTNRLTFGDAKRFLELIQSKKKPGEIVLLSAEPMYRHVISNLSGDYWERKRAYIQRLGDLLADAPVRVVSVFRRQDGFLRSHYQERIRKTKYDKVFSEFLNEAKFMLEYYQQIKLFNETFSDIQLMIYEELARENLVQAFFRNLQIDVAGLDTSGTANQSLPVELVEYRRLLNGTALDIVSLRKMTKRLSKYARRGRLRDPEAIDWWSDRRMAQLVDSFAASNERLRREFAAHLPIPLFPAPEGGKSVPRMIRDYPGMSASRFARLTTDIFL
ncbi:MAG: hypothetical protein GY798_06280 [Hyphomicrobiales bacterium]|nr:hypothetical protein [Hyphomicrobiales bacterium]